MARSGGSARIFTSRNVYEAGASGRGCFEQCVVSLTLAGTCDYDMQGEPFSIGKGALTLILPGVSQHWQVHEASRWEVIYCIFSPRPAWHAWPRLAERPPGYVHLPVQEPEAYRQVRACFEQLLRSVGHQVPYQVEFDLNLVERILLWCHALHRARESPVDRRVRAGMDYIARHLGEPLSLEILAAAAGASRSRFASLFRAQAGVTPMAYVEQQRLDRAMQLLEYGSDPISEIARQVGYEDPHYFANRFRRSVGCSPRAFRRRETR